MDPQTAAVINAVIWLVALAFFVVVEALTYNLVCIWFSAGAIAAFVMALLNFNVVVQETNGRWDWKLPRKER